MYIKSSFPPPIIKGRLAIENQNRRLKPTSERYQKFQWLIQTATLIPYVLNTQLL